MHENVRDVLLLAFAVKLMLIRISASQPTVTFELENGIPLSQNATTGIYKNDQIQLRFKCSSTSPVQWVLDHFSRSSSGRNREEWTERLYLDPFDKDEVYEYVAHIKLEYKNRVEGTDKLYCKGVNDSIIGSIGVTITSFGYTVQVTQDVATDAGELDETTKDDSCPVEVLLKDDGGETISFLCQGEANQRTGLSFKECIKSATHCANTFRIAKLNSCYRISNSSELVNLRQRSWKQLDKNNAVPGIAVCTDMETSQRRAVEYFFADEQNLNQEAKTFRRIHFSWDEVDPSIFIKLTSVDQIYYANTIIEVKCTVPKYGFSNEPSIGLFHDAILLHLEKRFSHRKTPTGVQYWDGKLSYRLEVTGKYTVICLAPIWNSIFWGNISRSFSVEELVNPYFDVQNVTIKLRNGETDRKVQCSAKGNPKPSIRWKIFNTPSVLVRDGSLQFLKATQAIDGIYVCEASNKFGTNVTKQFRVVVEQQKNLQNSMNAGVIVGISIGVIVSLGIILALILLYFKFMKLGKQIVMHLTKEEIEEFLQGNQKNLNENRGSFCIDNLPYNKKYDIPKENLKFDPSHVIGSGEYGIIMEGHLITQSGETVSVAIKTVKKEASISYFKALLSELKILAYIEQHSNIVNLLGAWTKNIQQKELLVCVELCKCSILHFLRDNRSQFLHLLPGEDTESGLKRSNSEYINSKPKFTTNDLIKWSLQICEAMEFLAKKKVIHGDLAARNVLLTFELEAKICDFGLARQLIDYNYIKSESCPLPWKWMAIESLSDMKFSTLSDVWAYGVTIWEIFSLGEIPYPGMTWTMDFVDNLRSGLRMKSPKFAYEPIYTIMVDSWNVNPLHRPSFTEIRQTLLKFP